MRRIATLIVAGTVLFTVGNAAATQPKHKQPTCDQVAAKMYEGAGGKSTDQVAAELKTSVKHVRECMDKVDAAKKKSGGTGGSAGSPPN